MAKGLQLAWMDVGSKWVPGRPFPIRLRLTSSDALNGLQLLEGPNPALGFALFREGEAPHWHAGAEATAMAGIEGSQGMVATGALGPGQTWETVEELNKYWLPPAPGRYRLAARYLTSNEAVETPPRELEVSPANLVASDAVQQRASENLLAQAWGDNKEVWLRLAPGSFPLAPRWTLPAGNWPGKGQVRIAQQAFSPLADPPIPAYRFWVVWLSQDTLAGSLVDHQGKTIAGFAEKSAAYQGCELLTPVQQENAALFIPLASRDSRAAAVTWYRVAPSGGRAAEWGKWPVPVEARQLMIAASPAGSIALVYLDSSRQNAFGAVTPLQPAAPAWQQLSHFDAGRILFAAVLDLRQGINLLLVRGADQELRSVSLHQRGIGGNLDAGPIPIPKEISPRDFRATWIARVGAALAMRDDRNRLWAVTASPGAVWKPVEGLQASENYGIAGSLTGVVIWAADAILGLRFVRAMLF